MAYWLWAVPPENYPVYVKTGTFAIRKVGRQTLAKIRPGDRIFAYLSGRKVIAGMFEAVGVAFEDSTPLVRRGHFPHRLRVRPIVALAEENWASYQAFHDKLHVVDEYPDFRAVVQQVIHALPAVDGKVLEFLVRARETSNLEQVFTAYEAYLKARDDRKAEEAENVIGEPQIPFGAAPFDRAEAVEVLTNHIEAEGYLYEPWQVAAYVTALRTKPFVILAGVSGTGKSRFPALVAAGTGGESHLIPVRPDWTDSADVLGYVDLQGRFHEGTVFRAAREAQAHPDRHVTCILDEMNLARPEHYFAEILSFIEDRHPVENGGYASTALPLPSQASGIEPVLLGPNLALVGTVNMDESAHGFSRKVLDRAFTLELAEVDLAARPGASLQKQSVRWPVSAWYPRARRLSELEVLSRPEQQRVKRVQEVLASVNVFLTPAQVQVAYRTRDEVSLFVLHAAEITAAFRSRDGTQVDPLDLALHMKVLPRLLGGSRPIRRAVLGLLGWTAVGVPFGEAEDARATLEAWERAERPVHLPEARFPRTAARLCLMCERLLEEGFTSFWV